MKKPSLNGRFIAGALTILALDALIAFNTGCSSKKAPAPPGPDCSLSRADCLHSTSCTLENISNDMNGDIYRCRAERGPCEVGIAQDDEAACTAKAGCKFAPASSYCACDGRTETVRDSVDGCQCDGRGRATGDVCAAVTRAILPLFGLLALAASCTKDASSVPSTASTPTEHSPTATEQDASPTPPPSLPTPADQNAPPVAIPPADAPCDSLSRAQCLLSSQCTLELVDHNVYRCRPDSGPCEIGIQQTKKTSCATKSECKFDPGGCYCHCEGAARTEKVDEKPSGCACGCGGGKPPMCLPR